MDPEQRQAMEQAYSMMNQRELSRRCWNRGIEVPRGTTMKIMKELLVAQDLADGGYGANHQVASEDPVITFGRAAPNPGSPNAGSVAASHGLFPSNGGGSSQPTHSPHLFVQMGSPSPAFLAMSSGDGAITRAHAPVAQTATGHELAGAAIPTINRGHYQPPHNTAGLTQSVTVPFHRYLEIGWKRGVNRARRENRAGGENSRLVEMDTNDEMQGEAENRSADIEMKDGDADIEMRDGDADIDMKDSDADMGMKDSDADMGGY